MNKILTERLIKDQPDYNLTEDMIKHEIEDLGREIVICPACGKVTLDSYFICSNCLNEFGYYEDDYNSPVVTNMHFESEEQLEDFILNLSKEVL